MPSTYDPNIPLATDNLNVSQVDILQNFQQLDTTYGINHFKFSDNTTNNGKHQFVQISEIAEGTLPAGLVSGDETLYATKVTVGAPLSFIQGELFFARGTGIANPIQMTCGKNNQLPFNNANGATFLPGGLLIQWGSFNPNSSLAVVFPTPFQTAPYSIQLTGSADDNSTYRVFISTGSVTATGFTVQATISSHLNPIYWMAIGNTI